MVYLLLSQKKLCDPPVVHVLGALRHRDGLAIRRHGGDGEDLVLVVDEVAPDGGRDEDLLAWLPVHGVLELDGRGAHLQGGGQAGPGGVVPNAVHVDRAAGAHTDPKGKRADPISDAKLEGDARLQATGLRPGRQLAIHIDGAQVPNDGVVIDDELQEVGRVRWPCECRIFRQSSNIESSSPNIPSYLARGWDDDLGVGGVLVDHAARDQHPSVFGKCDDRARLGDRSAPNTGIVP